MLKIKRCELNNILLIMDPNINVYLFVGVKELMFEFVRLTLLKDALMNETCVNILKRVSKEAY